VSRCVRIENVYWSDFRLEHERAVRERRNIATEEGERRVIAVRSVHSALGNSRCRVFAARLRTFADPCPFGLPPQPVLGIDIPFPKPRPNPGQWGPSAPLHIDATVEALHGHGDKSAGAGASERPARLTTTPSGVRALFGLDPDGLFDAL
jgi:hypothetical protein